MIDLETLATSNNALILTIGYALFNNIGLLDSGVIHIKPENKYEFDIDPNTVLWWFKQSKEAQNKLNSDNNLELRLALKKLNYIISGTMGIWGNGATFDNVILANAYKKVGIKYPVSFRNNKCYRTIINLLGKDVIFERIGEHHSAEDDAKTQAIHLIKVLNRHNLQDLLK